MTQENWKEEFNTLFGYASKVEIEYFISALLAEERNKVLSEVEREVEMNYDIDFNMQDEPFRENNSYNQALDDILKIINNLKMSLAFHKAFPNGVNLNTMNEIQELTITMRFPVRMNPGNEGHLKQVAMAYLKPKGVVVYEEEGKIIIE